MLHSSHSSCRGEAMAGEEYDGTKTVECLRGRLLAERVASKTAKAEADHMAKRLAELEMQLEEEIKHRERAEKRLNQALKKLESLKLDFHGHLNLSDSSMSSSSSTKCFSSKIRLEKWKEMGQCELAGEDLLGDSIHQLFSQDGSWNSIETASSRNKETPQGDGASSGIGSTEFVDGTLRQPSYDGCDDDQAEHDAEERLALVPVSRIQESAGSNPVGKNDVHEVLVALRHLREKLQGSLGKRVSVCFVEEPNSRRLASIAAMEAASTK